MPNVNYQQKFLNTIKKTFKPYITGDSTNVKKTRTLHSGIASHIQSNLQKHNLPHFQVISLDEENTDQREITFNGKYYEKSLDIAVVAKNDLNKVRAAISVKFVMGNYKQNSNNYFENMLGETVNCKNQDPQLLYYHLIILLSRIPYFNNKGGFKHWEILKPDNKFIKKYIKLGKDQSSTTNLPNNILLFIVKNPFDIDAVPTNKNAYKQFFEHDFELDVFPLFSSPIENPFVQDCPRVVFNDYESFLNQMVEDIKALETAHSSKGKKHE
jgi:hypothetical protein